MDGWAASAEAPKARVSKDGLPGRNAVSQLSPGWEGVLLRVCPPSTSSGTSRNRKAGATLAPSPPALARTPFYTSETPCYALSPPKFLPWTQRLEGPSHGRRGTERAKRGRAPTAGQTPGAAPAVPGDARFAAGQGLSPPPNYPAHSWGSCALAGLGALFCSTPLLSPFLRAAS